MEEGNPSNWAASAAVIAIWLVAAVAIIFIVAYDNVGIWPGLIAAAALLIDYVLTVAVSITTGVAAFTSTFPALLPFRVKLCRDTLANRMLNTRPGYETA